MENKTLFGIFHTAYERAGDYFYDVANADWINTIIVESDYNSKEFKTSMDELVKHPDKQVWVAVTSIGFKITNNVTVEDTGESKGEFNPVAVLHDDFEARIDALVNFLKVNGYYNSVVGFYMDEPLLWNITNDNLERFTGYFRTKAAPDKRFFICFSVAGVAPEYWTINDVKPITPKSAQYLTDVAYDMYHKWNDSYEAIFNLMKQRTGDRDDMNYWLIPCTMNYRSQASEEHCLEHLNNCYEILKKQKNQGGLMCYTQHTFKQEEEALGNIGLDNLADPDYKDYWPNLVDRIKQIGTEIVNKG